MNRVMKLLNSKKYYIWGTGIRAEQINRYYVEQLKQINLIGYIDNTPSKWEGEFFGKKIYSPNILRDDKDSNIIVVSKFAEEIIHQIKKEYPWYEDKIETLFFERLQVMARYKNCKEKEIQHILSYLNDHPFHVFNYPFVDKYKNISINIEYDEEKELYYTLHYNKRMYFSRSFKSKDRVREYYRFICIEQDIKSPHRYLTDTFNVPDNAVVVDAGAAEGNFALSIIESAKKIYMFEPDAGWVEALKYTFEPYKEKVEIINKCLSNYIDNTTTTIDEVLNGAKVDFIKMDIEGEEYCAIEGAQESIVSSGDIKCVVCTYHQDFAHNAIKKLLETLNFKNKTSDGYMWYPEDFNIMRAPVLRRGVIRAEKREK